MKHLNKATGLKKLCVLVALTVSLTSCIGGGSFWNTVSGSGNIVSEAHDLTGFESISVGGSADLFVTVSDEWLVELTTDDNLHEYVEVFTDGKTLVIRNREMVNLRPSDRLTVRVSMPAINGLTASGASNATIESSLKQDSFSVSASGSSDVHLWVELDEFFVQSSGSSDVYAGGYSRFVSVSLSGSSDFRGNEFTCDVAEVSLSGSSNMWATITESVSGQLSGSSDLNLNGTPAVDVRTSGSSDVNLNQ